MSLSPKESNVGFALFLVMLVITSALITYMLIYNHNKSITNPLDTTKTPNYFSFKSVSESKTVDVFEQYPVNPITINYDNDVVSITGLKDKSIQNKINLQLKELEPYHFLDTPTCNIGFNVSNVLSLDCENTAITLNLVTGEKLTIEEIFNQESDMYAITMDALYQSFCEYNSCYPDSEYNNEYYNTIENDIARSYQDIKNDNYNISLNYNYATITFPTREYSQAYYEFYRYPEDITIYNRYLTDESIYTNEITNYCSPKGCFYSNIDEDNAYNSSAFLTSHNFLTTYLYNNTRYDMVNQNEFSLSELDLDLINKKVMDELILKYNLKRETNNYQDIEIHADIYNTNFGYKNILYSIYINEYKKEDFIKNSLGYYESEPVRTTTINKINMILTPNNNISYLEEEPNNIFNNFESELLNHIKLDMLKGLESNFYNYTNSCEFSEDYDECLKDIDYSKLIKNASYSIDTENKKIYMYYLEVLGPGIANYVNTEIPFDLFTLK